MNERRRINGFEHSSSFITNSSINFSIVSGELLKNNLIILKINYFYK